MNYFPLFITRLTVLVVPLSLVGCGAPAAPTASTSAPEATTVGATADAAHDHSGWWCNEHGVPEEECTRCDASLVAGFKERNDWCAEHERPDSQCFVCHPEWEAKFAARYAAKFGRQPPKPTEP